ncbi:MAG: hypothetical protein KatS3mg115_0871 [Candidatus Poribacteria bacterium]|nr:MAG: hypothetical protein KatS3mg115_0871 [Candidatus Poribacteria bacterium]
MSVQETAQTVRVEIARQKYRQLLVLIDQDVARVRAHPAVRPCPATCRDCCQSGALLPLAPLELEPMLDALERFPAALQRAVLERAAQAAWRLEAAGIAPETAAIDPLGEASALLDDRPEGRCPFLIGGVCSVYPDRPPICRVWGAPLWNGRSVDCCPKTCREKAFAVRDAVDYLDYWQKVRLLSESFGNATKEPMAFLLLRRWKERGHPLPWEEPTPSG